MQETTAKGLEKGQAVLEISSGYGNSIYNGN